MFLDASKGTGPAAGLTLAALLTALLPGAARAGDIDEASLGLPRVEACSARYVEVDAPRPSGADDGHTAIREGFDTHRHWGTERNVERLDTAQTGLGVPGLRVHYPAGTSSPGDDEQGGAGFYTEPASLAGAEQACLSYRVRFEPGFDFVKGGKLPGLYGGEAPSGGETADGENGFSMRLMWRELGQGELYEYVVDQEGTSVGRGAWTFPSGEWVTIEQEIVLNDHDQANGLARLWIDGQPVLEQRDIVYRTTPDLTIDGLMFSTFFGGTGEEWRTPRDQYADFADFRLLVPGS
ncbi:polysaccharide lyase [Halomonas sp. C05BenzN]|uniref:polysaccharide lyase n=1 Tax=Halomonas sp. C05BenzN TaxID=3411041 RepID=UPI003B94A60F